jgi:DNA-binding CsgD family transcriptional regulator
MHAVPGASERIVAVFRPPAHEHATSSDGEGLALRLLLPFIDGALRRLPIDAPPLPKYAPTGRLSLREREIMRWVALGKTNPEIGCILRISEFTVKNHLKSIFSKLDVSNRAQAVARLTRLATPA